MSKREENGEWDEVMRQAAQWRRWRKGGAKTTICPNGVVVVSYVLVLADGQTLTETVFLKGDEAYLWLRYLSRRDA
jgi:hypothetical protein